MNHLLLQFLLSIRHIKKGIRRREASQEPSGFRISPVQTLFHPLKFVSAWFRAQEVFYRHPLREITVVFVH